VLTCVTRLHPGGPPFPRFCRLAATILGACSHNAPKHLDEQQVATSRPLTLNVVERSSLVITFLHTAQRFSLISILPDRDHVAHHSRRAIRLL